MLEFLEMQSTPSLPSFPSPLCPGVVTPERVLSMGQIKLNWVLMLNRDTSNKTVLTFKLCELPCRLGLYNTPSSIYTPKSCQLFSYFFIKIFFYLKGKTTTLKFNVICLSLFKKNLIEDLKSILALNPKFFVATSHEAYKLSHRSLDYTSQCRDFLHLITPTLKARIMMLYLFISFSCLWINRSKKNS